MSQSLKLHISTQNHDKTVIKQTGRKTIHLKPGHRHIPIKHLADIHAGDVPSKSKKCKVMPSVAPAPVNALRIVSTCKDMLEAMEKLMKHTMTIRATVSSLDDINANVKSLMDNVKQLDQEIDTMKMELKDVGKKVVNIAEDIKHSRLEISNIMELVKHIDAQIEQDWDLRIIHESKEKARSQCMADQLQILIKVLSEPIAETE